MTEKTGTEDGRLNRILLNFHCEKDNDIENFLHNKAVEFDSLAKAKTYLVCDEDAMTKGRFDILGYISVSLKALILPEVMSIRQRKDIDGYSGKLHGMPIREIPCYLIGQLAKNSDIIQNSVSGKDLLSYATAVIRNAAKAVGGRYMMIECHDNEKLLSFYKQNDFKVIMNMPLDGEPMVQMIRTV